MKEINYWDRFLLTGSVSDFLSYRNALENTEDDGIQNDTEKDRAGGQGHAGVYRDYGNDFKGTTHW